ncbi:hypothetical protein ACW66K_04215 [Aerococcus urinaeequi]|uniref:Uncharacterized protein n=1 Tax=Aerococcus viridans TaxID=1377 RepID=A0A2N6UBM0_9LACT|nr:MULTISPECIES: hypothetical protein [Aerococcus]OFU53075.1 hypothetical protein HMPREF3116_00925 [Aerococcus sp. HMSC10H05]PMC78939.1 hypothetical protein CJ191_08595 [Aerococcus viridans]
MFIVDLISNILIGIGAILFWLLAICFIPVIIVSLDDNLKVKYRSFVNFYKKTFKWLLLIFGVIFVYVIIIWLVSLTIAIFEGVFLFWL